MAALRIVAHYRESMKVVSIVRRGLAAILMVSGPTVARADNLVVAFSAAAPGYAESRMKDGKLQPQTYVVMQGQFYGGATRDRSLEKTAFSTIVNRLAVDLKEQAFVPARSLGEAYLLLLVHWGVTIGKGNDYELEGRDRDRGRQLSMQFNSARQFEADDDANTRADVGSAALRGEMDFEILQNSTDALNTELEQMPASVMLGFSRDLRNEQKKLMASEHQRTLVSLLETDRYFIVVIAYDRATLSQHKRLQRVWSCRLSMRSPGVNFPIALDRMGQVGGNFFGTCQSELKMVAAKKKRAEVKVGDAIVIEYDAK